MKKSILYIATAILLSTTSCNKDKDPIVTPTPAIVTNQYQLYDWTGSSASQINGAELNQTVTLSANYMISSPCLREGSINFPNQVLETDSYQIGSIGTMPVTAHYYSNDTVKILPTLVTMTGRYELRGQNKDTLAYSFSVNTDPRYFILWYYRVN